MITTLQIPASLELRLPPFLEYEGHLNVESWLLEKLDFHVKIHEVTADVRDLVRLCPSCGELAMHHTKGKLRPRGKCQCCGTRLTKADTYSPAKSKAFREGAA